MLDKPAAIGDPHFDQGPMRNEKHILGDRSDWDPVFDNKNKGVHGVILVTTKGESNNKLRLQVRTDNWHLTEESTCKTKSNEIISLFSNSIEKNPVVMDGRVREGETEFFGFRDGISQPALR